MSDQASKAYIGLYPSGKKFFLLEPRVEDIDIIDIAHSLSQQCRWTGHCAYHYSVAQHSYYCSLIGPPEEAFVRLMHDASEAFISDLNRPMKHYTDAGDAYLKVEERIEEAIGKRFGFSKPWPESVKIADNIMLYAEKAQITAYRFDESEDWLEGRAPDTDILISPWTCEVAESMFLGRFYELYKGDK
jgi:uncharacterized protein